MRKSNACFAKVLKMTSSFIVELCHGLKVCIRIRESDYLRLIWIQCAVSVARFFAIQMDHMGCYGILWTCFRFPVIVYRMWKHNNKSYCFPEAIGSVTIRSGSIQPSATYHSLGVKWENGTTLHKADAIQHQFRFSSTLAWEFILIFLESARASNLRQGWKGWDLTQQKQKDKTQAHELGSLQRLLFLATRATPSSALQHKNLF